MPPPGLGQGGQGRLQGGHGGARVRPLQVEEGETGSGKLDPNSDEMEA